MVEQTQNQTKVREEKNKNIKATSKVTEIFLFLFSWFHIQTGWDVQEMKTVFRKYIYIFKLNLSIMTGRQCWSIL